jgi:hypothetical protein
MSDLTKIEVLVMLSIFRKTYGWIDYVDYEKGQAYYKVKDNISLSQFSKLTGSSNSTIRKGIKGLLKKKYIVQLSKYNAKENRAACYAIQQKGIGPTPPKKTQGGKRPSPKKEQGGESTSPKNKPGVKTNRGQKPTGVPPQKNTGDLPKKNTPQKKELKESNKENNNKKKSKHNFSSKIKKIKNQIPEQLIDTFYFSFGKEPRPIQLMQFADMKLDFELITEYIKECGVKGHTQSYLFEGLSRLQKNKIYTLEKYKQDKNKALNKNNTSKSNKSTKRKKVDKGTRNKKNDFQDEVRTKKKVSKSNRPQSVSDLGRQIKPKYTGALSKQNVEEMWQEIIDVLDQSVPQNFNNYSFWLQDVDVEFDKHTNTFILDSSTLFNYKWIQENCSGLIEEIIEKLTNEKYNFSYKYKS